jgi:hypothetical protein
MRIPFGGFEVGAEKQEYVGAAGHLAFKRIVVKVE